MMSSIEALCGTQACHSFFPPGVCCWSHPFTGVIAKTLLVETHAQTVESPPISSRHGYGTVTLKNSVFGCLEFPACPLILSHNTHSFSLILCGRYTPLEKSPDHSPHQYGTQVASPSLAFTRWNIPKKKGKTPGRHKFPLFLTSTSPLRSNPLARQRKQTASVSFFGKWSLCIMQTSSCLDAAQKYGVRGRLASLVHSTLHHTQCHHRNRPTVFPCGGLFFMKVACLGRRELVWEHVCSSSSLGEWLECAECAKGGVVCVLPWLGLRFRLKHDLVYLGLWSLCQLSVACVECHSQKPSVGEGLNWNRFYLNLTAGSNDKVQSWKTGQGQTFLY